MTEVVADSVSKCRRFDRSCRRVDRCCRRVGCRRLDLSPSWMSPTRLVADLTCIRAVVSTSACHAGGPGSRPGPGTLLGVKTWLSTLEIVYLCLSDETLKAVGPFYLVSMPGEVKDPTSPHWKCVTCGGFHNTTL